MSALESLRSILCCTDIELLFIFDFQRTTCNSIVAILTLEVTGIPELSENRDFPWPKPSFIEPTRSHLFEVSTQICFFACHCFYILISYT